MPHAEHSIAWSPDSRQFAFLSDTERSGQLRLYVQTAGSSSAHKVTSLTGFPGCSALGAGWEEDRNPCLPKTPRGQPGRWSHRPKILA